MSLYDCIEKINVEKAVEYVSKLQQEDGSFVGDKWGMLIIYLLGFFMSSWWVDIFLKMIRTMFKSLENIFNLLKDCLRCFLACFIH